MAKLNPSDPQFGIPVASRLKAEVANELNTQAQGKNISLSKHIAEVLSEAETTRQKSSDLQKELDRTIQVNKTVIGKFILELSGGNKQKATDLATLYNKIQKDEKQK